jgi:hypothetical protein
MSAQLDLGCSKKALHAPVSPIPRSSSLVKGHSVRYTARPANVSDTGCSNRRFADPVKMKAPASRLPSTIRDVAVTLPLNF